MGFILRCLLVSTAIGVNSWILRRSCIHYAIFSYIRENAVLQGSIIATLKNKSPAECESECINSHFCRSINTESGGDRKCELNIETEADTTANLTLTPKTGWTFKSTNYSDPWVGEYCKFLKPCPVNHVCMDSCQCPGYECYRCRGMKIGINCLTEMVGTGKPLGVEDRSIKDYQMSASSSYAMYTRGRNARLNLNERWCSKYEDKQPYLRVDFARRKIITDIAVQGNGYYDEWVTSYELEYTEDLTSWQTYEEDGAIKIFDGPKTRNVVVKQSLQYYIRAFSIKLSPKTWLSWACMRIEVYGVADLLQPPDVVVGFPLGIEDNRVENYAMISSSQNNDLKESAYHGRLNHNSQWCAKDPATMQEYIRVYFASRKIITAVEIQGHHYLHYFVSSYELRYAEDKYDVWQHYKEDGAIKVFDGSTTNYWAVRNRLKRHIRVLAIELIPKSWKVSLCMRMELYGIEDPQQPATRTECVSNERPLGMESRHIADNQITASSTYDSRYWPFNARLNNNANWCSRGNDIGQFLQVDLGKKMIVTAVATQGRPVGNGWTKSYRVSFSDSTAEPFIPIFKVFTGNTDKQSVVQNRLSTPIAAQFIRLIPVDAVGHKWCLRAELYGCEGTNLV